MSVSIITLKYGAGQAAEARGILGADGSGSSGFDYAQPDGDRTAL